MNELTEIQVRVLGCLMEKKETTPDQYPLTLNSLRNACNQKSSRHPITQYNEGEVGHTIRELETLGLVREEFGARVSRYEHLGGKAFGLHSKGIAILTTMMLRGPQTVGELRTHSHRMYEFDDLDDINYVLGKLADRDPALVIECSRQPGQKETRYAHLLAGKPKLEAIAEKVAVTTANPGGKSALESRVKKLENQLEELAERVKQLESFSQ